MARPGILYVEVKQAAEEMTARGVAPTIERVRQQLGAGSFSTLSRHLRSWREEKKNSAEVTAGVPPPDAVGSAVQRVWQELQGAADARVAEVEARCAAAQAEARAEAERQVQAAARRTEEAEGARSAAAQALEETRGALVREAQRARDLELDLAGAREKLTATAGLVEELRRQVEVQRLDGAQRLATQRAEAEERYGLLEAQKDEALKHERAFVAEERARCEELAEARAEAMEQLGQVRTQLREREGAWQEERRLALKEEQAQQAHLHALAAENGRLAAANHDDERRLRSLAEERAADLLLMLESLRERQIHLEEQHDEALQALRQGLGPLGELGEGQGQLLGRLDALTRLLQERTAGAVPETRGP